MSISPTPGNDGQVWEASALSYSCVDCVVGDYMTLRGIVSTTQSVGRRDCFIVETTDGCSRSGRRSLITNSADGDATPISYSNSADLSNGIMTDGAPDGTCSDLVGGPLEEELWGLSVEC